MRPCGVGKGWQRSRSDLDPRSFQTTVYSQNQAGIRAFQGRPVQERLSKTPIPSSSLSQPAWSRGQGLWSSPGQVQAEALELEQNRTHGIHGHLSPRQPASSFLPSFSCSPHSGGAVLPPYSWSSHHLYVHSLRAPDPAEAHLLSPWQWGYSVGGRRGVPCDHE